MCGHVVADEEALTLHDDVGWWLVSCSNVRGPDRDGLTGVDFDCAVELEKSFVFAGATNQLPPADLNFLIK